jgi:hypothetical protein
MIGISRGPGLAGVSFIARPKKRAEEQATVPTPRDVFERQYPLKEACQILGLKRAMLIRLAVGVPGYSEIQIGPKQKEKYRTFSESALRVILNRMQGG